MNTYNRSPTAADPRPMVIRSIDFKDGPKFITKDALLLTADFKATPRLVLSFNAIYTYTEGAFWNRSFTFVAANDNSNVNNGRSRVTGDGMLTVGTQRTTANTVPTVNNGGGSSAKLTYTRTFAPKFEYKLRGWTFDGAASFSRSVNNYEALERGFAEGEGLALASDWVASRPNRESWEWTIRQTSGPDWYNLKNWTGGTRVENSAREWATEIWNGQLNAQWVLPFLRQFATKVKFGGKWNEESRNNNNEDTWNTWRYVGPGGDVITGRNATTGVPTITTSGSWANLGFVAPHPFDTGTTNGLTVFNLAGIQGMPPRADRNRMGALFRSNPELFVHTGTPTNYYDAFIAPKRDYRQTVTSGYTQADIRVSAALNVRVGVRWERTQNAVTEWDPRFRDEVTAAGYPVNATGLATTFAGLRYQYQSLPRVTRRAEYDNFSPPSAASIISCATSSCRRVIARRSAARRSIISLASGVSSRTRTESPSGSTRRTRLCCPRTSRNTTRAWPTTSVPADRVRPGKSRWVSPSSTSRICAKPTTIRPRNSASMTPNTPTIPFARPATATAAVATGIWNFPTSKRWASCRRSFAARVLTSPTRARMRAPAATVSRRTVCPPVSAMPTVDLTARSAWCGRMSGRTETTVAIGLSRPNSICRPRGNSPTATRSTCRPATLPISR